MEALVDLAAGVVRGGARGVETGVEEKVVRWIALGILAATAACAAGTHSEGATGAPPGQGYTEADVRFVQGMIPHHAQALVMTELVAVRTGSAAMRRMARRIEVSQKDEIAIMERWLERRAEPVPGAHLHGSPMPGMLTEEELARLAATSGEEFDRLFLELMIRHHEGALVMVADLFDSGGGQEAEIFQLASHVDADQRAEIARMRDMHNILIQEADE